MWKPGAKKPKNGGAKRRSKSKTPQSKEKSKEKRTLSTASEELLVGDSGLNPTDSKGTRSPEAAIAKKLSGATMNMRFMQRSHSKSPARSRQSSEQRSKDQGSFSPLKTLASSTRKSPADPDTPQQHSADDDDLDMSDADETDDSDEEMAEAASSDDDNDKFCVATPADIYGHGEITIIGRRSFGGFNPNIAEAWNASKTRAEQMSKKEKSTQPSDLELIRRANRQKERHPRQGASSSSPNDGGISSAAKKRRRRR